VRRHRTAAALSQEELAARAGLSVRAISDLERGVHPMARLETLRRLADGNWILGGFLSSEYALGYRVMKSPTAVRAAPLQCPIVGSAWADEDHAGCRVAQLYGGYVLPGSKLDVAGGVGLVVSQWNTQHGWPYRAMQFRVTLHDTT